MRGERNPFRRIVEVELAEDVELGAPLTHFLRAVVRHETDGRLEARLTGAQGSGLLTSMALANALLVIPAERARVAAGERVRAMLVTDDALHAPTLHLA
jgi:molybdopterin molybdotransferase